jgi:hypothetical protein
MERTSRSLEALPAGRAAATPDPYRSTAVALEDHRPGSLAQRAIVQSVSAARPSIQAPAGAAAPVQRVVLSKVQTLEKGGTQIVYYTTYDPKKNYDTQAEAEKADAEFRSKAPALDRDRRYPTGFTYRDPGNKPTSVSNTVIKDNDNGPHSIPHVNLTEHVKREFSDPKHDVNNLKRLRDEQVPTPDKFDELYEAERGSKVKDSQAERAKTDYRLLYGRLDAIIKGGKDTGGDEAYELLMRLIQMHPYTAYGAAKQGHARLKRKNEASGTKFEAASDDLTSFKDPKNYAAFRETRNKLWPADEPKSGAEGKEEKGSGESPAKAPKVEGGLPNGPSPVVRIENRAELAGRGWNAGDRFIMPTEGHDVEYRWVKPHIGGTALSKGDFVVHLRGG